MLWAKVVLTLALEMLDAVTRAPFLPPSEVTREVAQGAELCEAPGHGGCEGRGCSSRSIGKPLPGFGVALGDVQYT